MRTTYEIGIGINVTFEPIHQKENPLDLQNYPFCQSREWITEPSENIGSTVLVIDRMARSLRPSCRP